VAKLQVEAGAELIELDPERDTGPISKLRILRQIGTPKLLGLRKRWTAVDAVLVIGWYLIPVLLLVRLRFLRRPRRLVSMAVFVQGQRVRHALNLLLRVLKINELELIVFSEAERANLIDVIGIPAERVHRVVYRGKMSEAAASRHEGGYIFTGGYTNRDYDTFFAAVAPLEYDVIAVASALNDLGDPPPNVDLRIDIPWNEFEELVASCALLVLPLKQGGEACGQNVLFRGMRNYRPVVATRHESLIDYLGDDYPGFVPAHDSEALRAAIERALSDGEFRESILGRLDASLRALEERGDVETEILRILVPTGAQEDRSRSI
jgi:glycosyltransferase involved in cell wall biosynthesis